MNKERIKVAIVGLGVGRGHLEAYRKLPELFSVEAVCDLDESRLASCDVPWKTKSFDDLLRSERIELINLCTPPNTHLRLIEQALAAGKHVICEKPLVGSLQEADAVEAALRKTQAQLFPIFQYRFGHGIQQLRFLRSRGFAQHALLSVVETHWRRGPDYYTIPWRGKWATEMGGVCLTQACHAHDMLSYVLGPVRSVYARLATRVNDIEGEDCAAITLEMADGSVAVLSATLGAAKETSRLKFMFNDMTVESDSPNHYRPGKAPWHFIGKTPEMDAAIQAALRDFKPELESFEGEFALVHAALSSGAPTPVTVADARASLELITAIYHSGERGEAVQMPIPKHHPKYSSWVPTQRGFSKALHV